GPGLGQPAAAVHPPLGVRGDLSALVIPAWLGIAATALACASAVPPALHLAAPLGPLGGEVRVLAPPPARSADGPLPVVYFLHDFWGSDAVLWEHGVPQRLYAREERGELPPFLLVAPEGDRGFWVDSWDGARRYQQWLREDLPRWVARRWPVRAGRAGRAFVGISMGGLGAADACLAHAERCGALVSISGLLVPLDARFVRDARWPLRRALTRVFGEAPDAAAVRGADPYRCLGSAAAGASGERPRLLLLAGTSDKYRLDGAADLFARRARENGLDVELRLAPGGHDWAYWRTAAEDGIAWAVR